MALHGHTCEVVVASSAARTTIKGMRTAREPALDLERLTSAPRPGATTAAVLLFSGDARGARRAEHANAPAPTSPLRPVDAAMTGATARNRHIERRSRPRLPEPRVKADAGHERWQRPKRTFARRHVLTHNGRIVDEKFLTQVPDSGLRLGQRLVVRRADAAQALDGLQAVVRCARCLAVFVPTAPRFVELEEQGAHPYTVPPGLRPLRGHRSVAPRTVRGLENYPGRGFTWRCSCQSSPAASSASWMRCHAAPSDSSSRMRTCPRSSGISVPRPRSLATAASSSSARLPGRITWTMIAVSGTRADRIRGHRHTPPEPPIPPPPARKLTPSRAGRDGWAAAERTVRPLGVVSGSAWI
jgi:hypothetical protein